MLLDRGWLECIFDKGVMLEALIPERKIESFFRGEGEMSFDMLGFPKGIVYKKVF